MDCTEFGIWLEMFERVLEIMMMMCVCMSFLSLLGADLQLALFDIRLLYPLGTRLEMTSSEFSSVQTAMVGRNHRKIYWKQPWFPIELARIPLPHGRLPTLAHAGELGYDILGL